MTIRKREKEKANNSDRKTKTSAYERPERISSHESPTFKSSGLEDVWLVVRFEV
jgi:hypothetical protein